MQADIAPAFHTATRNPFSSEELGKGHGDRDLDDYKWGLWSKREKGVWEVRPKGI